MGRIFSNTAGRVSKTKVSFGDFLREVPTGTSKTIQGIQSLGKSFLQGSLRSGAGVVEGVQNIGYKAVAAATPMKEAEVKQKFGFKPLTPTGPYQEEFYGTKKPITARSVGEELPGLKEGSKAAPYVGFALGVSDVFGGGKGIKGGAKGLLKIAEKIGPAERKAFEEFIDAIRVTKKVSEELEVTVRKLADDIGLDTNKINPKLADELTSLLDVNRSQSRVVLPKAQHVERGFTTSAKQVLPRAEKIGGQYVPRETSALAIKAKNLIKEDLLTAEKIAQTGSDDNAVAVASELLKKYADDAAQATDEGVRLALYDKAADIANTLAPKLTEQGRSIQAASILGKLTPEGQVRFVAREIQKYNEMVESGRGGMLGLQKKIPELTGSQAKTILDEMKAINAMADGEEKALRFKEFQDGVLGLIPSHWWDKVVAVWKAGLLTGVKTTGLNMFSNLSHGVSEVAKDLPAVVVDSVASLFTGQRTKTLTTRGVPSGVKEGFKKGVRYFKTGFDTRDVATKLDYNRVNFGKGPVAKAFQTYTDTVFRSLGSQDQPFYYGALARSLMDQALAQGKNAGKKGKDLVAYAQNLVQNPTAEMIQYGVIDATTAVFQNKTALGAVARTIQKIPVIGQVVLPFGKTPSAVATQIVNYTPVGIAKTIIENIGKGRFDQRLFSQGIGRGLTGTAILAIGGELARRGLVALDRPTGEREQKLWEAEGRKPNSIKVGDKWRAPTVLGPAGSALLIGAHFYNALQSEGSPTAAISKATFGSLKSFFEQTFLTGINQLTSALNDPERFGAGYLSSLISSLAPTLVSDVAKATDPKERRAESVFERVQARVPFFRNKLEPQVDVLGRERERMGNPLEVLFDPTRPSPSRETPVTEEIRRLFDSGLEEVTPTLLGDKKGYNGLTQEQNTDLWKRAGEITNEKLSGLFQSEKYQSRTDEEKAETIEKFIDLAKVAARAEMVLEVTDGLEEDALTEKLAELKEGGLMTKEVFKKYKELR